MHTSPPSDPFRPDLDEERHSIAKHQSKRKPLRQEAQRKGLFENVAHATIRGGGMTGSVLNRMCNASDSRRLDETSLRSKLNGDDEGSWFHDKYEYKFSSELSPKRDIPRDYRPPSPKWVSRAGGVAIMRRHSDEAYDMR